MAFRVLVIDDTSVIRDFLHEVLSDAGFEVDIAVDGQMGCEKAIKNDYLMIFCDVHMPILNGLEAIKKIKKVKPEIPVIMTDSYPDKLAQQATEVGAICCLAKPFALDELREIVERIMQSRKMTVK